MYSNVFCYDYNWAVLLITLILLYEELKSQKEKICLNIKKDLLLRDIGRKYNTI